MKTPETTRSMIARHIPLALVAATTLFLNACTSVGTDYRPPVVEVPTDWRESTQRAFTAEARSLTEWWRQLNDPVLDGLVVRALQSGPDLREAVARLREARARRGIAGAEQFPALGSGAAYQRRGESEHIAAGAFAGDSTVYTTGLDASWELDLWGRVRRLVEAADADFAAGIEDTREVALLLSAETAANYVELRSFQRRAGIAHTNVRLQEQTLEIVRARFDAGLVGERDVAQALTNVDVTRSRVPALAAGARAAENRLAVLLGLAPGQLADELEYVRPIPIPPSHAAVGLPADLVRNRPDVRRAERTLAAEHARIGVAKGDLYPRLALSGNLGLAADDASDLFRRSSNVFGFGPSVRWSLFEGGRLRGRVAAQEARAERAFVRWERTVLSALEETETAMSRMVREQARRELLSKAAAQARRAAELAQFEYNEGLTDFQAVLDSERALALLEDDLAVANTAIARQFIVIQKALGDTASPPPS
jgi:NodT family efflux transporter outer membrane factor (OMF) lipoprotein